MNAETYWKSQTDITESILLSEVSAIEFEIKELKKRHSYSLDSSTLRKTDILFLQALNRLSCSLVRRIK